MGAYSKDQLVGLLSPTGQARQFLVEQHGEWAAQFCDSLVEAMAEGSQTGLQAVVKHAPYGATFYPASGGEWQISVARYQTGAYTCAKAPAGRLDQATKNLLLRE